MNISAGISQINLGGPEAQKIFLWPKYGQGKVNAVQRVRADEKNGYVYRKASPEERIDLEKQLASPKEMEYGRNGSYVKTSPVRPGSLFEAVV